ncbi:MAG TPA: hypothetical protein VFL13_01995 [Candidatus Baltobacteraceae bacterium]|nr:hypothetical protein [Candidatus Baltobacteraceae bacterium]
MSATEFLLQGGPGVGYVHIFTTSSTAKNTGGAALAAGQSVDVYGTGTLSSGNVTAATINIDSATSTSSTTPPAAGTYTAHVKGPIVAVKSASSFQIQGGPGIGYVNVSYTSSTTKNTNGQAIAVGTIADVYGGGTPSTTVAATWMSLSSSTSATSGTPAPTAAPVASSAVPAHVLTAGLVYGYAGTPTSVAVSRMAPYISWAQTDPNYAAQLRAAGIKVDIYMNFWRNYSSDNPAVGYTDLKPGGSHASAEVKSCAGTVAYDSGYGGGYEGNALSSSMAGHAAVLANYRESEYGSNYDALFSDDTGALYGLPTPCGYTDANYKSATNSVHASLGKKMFVNTLNAGTSVVSQVGYAGASNVLGAMCEGCYAYWNTSGTTKADYARFGSTWADTENGEALMVSQHKIFWAYPRAIGDASTETSLRTYVYASFLMTYDPNYAMLQEVFKTASGFEVFPETGLVPMNPVTTSTNVSSYLRSGGAYMREFGACYYRGVNKGKCAVVVNPSNTASASIPTTAYAHAMTLSGGGVLDGGSVAFTAGRPSSLAPETAAILFP